MGNPGVHGCRQSFFTFRQEVLEKLFRMCFCLVFANLDEMGEFLTDIRKSIDESTDGIKADINRIDKQIGLLNTKRFNFLDAIENGIGFEGIQSRVSKLNEEMAALTGHKKDLQAASMDSEEEYFRLVDEYSEKQLIGFVLAENHSVRRGYYERLIQAAWVYLGKIIIRYTNGKVFIIPLEKNRGRLIQKVFDIKVVFRGRLQYTLRYDVATGDYQVLEGPLSCGQDQERIRLFRAASLLRREEKVRSVMEKVSEFSKVEVMQKADLPG
jgi:hypothetical protein